MENMHSNSKKPNLTPFKLSSNVQYMYFNKYVIAFAILLFANVSQSKTFVEEMLERDFNRLENAPNRPESEIYPLRIYRMWDALGPTKIIRALEDAKSIPSVSRRVVSRVNYLLALAKARTGHLVEANHLFEKSGYINKWLVAGPFNNEGGLGIDTTFAPETNHPMDSETPMQGNGHDVFWRDAPKTANHLGYLDLHALHQPATNSCFFARSTLAAPKAQTGVLRIGAGGTVKAFWNNQLVIQDDKYRMSDPDRLAVEIPVAKGNNTLLVKVCTEERGDFGLFARVTDNSFKSLNLRPIEAQRSSFLNPVKSTEFNIKRIPQSAEILFKKATSANKDAISLAAASEYLYLTTSQNLNTTEARDMAKSACLNSRSEERCLLWSAVALDRNEQWVAIDAAHKRAPKSLAVLVAMARWEMDGPETAKAIPHIEKILKKRPASLEGRLLRIDLLSRRGFAKSAFAKIETLQKQYASMPGLLDFASMLAEEAGYLKKARTLKKEALHFNFDDVSRHEEAAMLALSQGDEKSLREHIRHLRMIAPSDDATYKLIARLLEGIKDYPEAEATLKARLDLAPRNAPAWIDLGLFLLRIERREDGLDALIKAAEYRPQDTWLAEYLKHLGPLKSFEEPYVIPETLFLSWRDTSPALNESRFLVDQSAIKVFASGLSSRFTQQVFEINNREDAKEWRTRYIQFIPDDQQVRILTARVFHPDGSIEKVVRRGTIPISEPWYRLYYDVAAEAMEFPKLAPGDVVELQYRVDDVATRNIFHDYFGDIAFIEDFTPKHYWRYTLIAPSSREFRFNSPTFPGLERSRSEENENVVYTFQAEQIPSIHREGDMPGLVEVAEYLHVSTYGSWTDLGKWYRGLVRHQMVPDQRIKDTVKKLVRGKKTDLDKISAIYNWVVTATRYVGLEFGIYGYKPYKAPMVVARGFGDCKDKTSLLVTMMKEAGIDAEFVLIRTNDLGILTSEPASLAVFNHAIAFVPKYNLYLDGTAEQHGIFELPFGDQGASAMLLQKDGAKFVTTKVASPDQNTTDVVTTVALDTKGNAELTTTATVKGTAAAPLRQLLEVEATRKKRFEGSLAAIYPGATLNNLKIHTISDLSKPASYTFEASVPSFADTTETAIEIPLDEGLHLVREYARIPRRSYDLILGAPRILSRAVTFILPEGFVNDALPPDVTLNTPFGSLVLTIVKEGKKMKITRKLTVKTHRVKPNDYPAFVSFCRDVDAALATHIVFRRVK